MTGKGTTGGGPTRWRAAPARRPASMDVLLRGARRPRPPGSGELARLGARVDQIPRESAARARRWSRVASLAAGTALLVLATGVFAWRGPRRNAAPPRLPAPAPALLAAASTPSAVAPPAPVAIEPPSSIVARSLVARAETPRPARHARPVRTATPEPAGSSADTLAREIALVDAARADLAPRPARALTSLDTHRREFPRGQLAAEREFLAVEALRRMGRIDEARRRAGELENRYPTSSYAARAARLLQAP